MNEERLPSREEAWCLLCEYTQGESLRRHARAVEEVMRAYARRLGEDEHMWGLTGLLHDFDYEAYPDPAEHTVAGGTILRERGYPEEIVHAIQAHNDANGLGLSRNSAMAKVLYACDELAGFITAVSLVRPSKSIHEVKPKSVKKKLKDKAFAAAVSRQDIALGIEELGVDPTEHIQRCIDAMRAEKERLGL